MAIGRATFGSAGQADLEAERDRAPARRAAWWPAVVRQAAGPLLMIWLPALLLLVWYFLSRHSTSLYSPPLSNILSVFRADFLTGQLASDLAPSLRSLFYGFAIACVVGLAGGYLLGLTSLGRAALAPLLDLFRSTPTIALIPVFLMIFGLGSTSEVLLIAWAAVWPILLATTDGIASIDLGYRDVGSVLRMSWLQRCVLLRIPAAAPRIFVGVNTAIAIAITSMVAIEMLSASNGLGRYLVNAQRNFDLASSYAGAIAAGVLGYLISVLLYLVERRLLLKWYFDMRTGGGGNGAS